MRYDDLVLRGFIPLGASDGGNLFCLRAGEVVFWDHDTDEEDVAADSFDDFVGRLVRIEEEALPKDPPGKLVWNPRFKPKGVK